VLLYQESVATGDFFLLETGSAQSLLRMSLIPPGTWQFWAIFLAKKMFRKEKLNFEVNN